MSNLIKKSTLNYFGLDKLGFYNSQTFKDFRDDLKDAILSNELLVIPGEVGAGKTILFQSALAPIDDLVKPVYVRNYYKEHCTISSIINAAIYDLSDESPRRDLEARSRQFIRIVGKLVTNETAPATLCIIIEEAHRLHPNTLRALKELRETSFAGISPLFSVVLIGHPELANRVTARKEVLWRSMMIELSEENGWMSYDERKKFLQSVFGAAIEAGARSTIANVCRQPLEMVQYVAHKMREAKRVGHKVIDAEVVKPTLRELFASGTASYRDIGKATGIAFSTVHAAINDSSFKNTDVKKTIEAFLFKKEIRRTEDMKEAS